MNNCESINQLEALQLQVNFSQLKQTLTKNVLNCLPSLFALVDNILL